MVQIENHQAGVSRHQSWYNTVACWASPDIGVERVKEINRNLMQDSSTFYNFFKVIALIFLKFIRVKDILKQRHTD
jgi:hypothetical protein